MIFHRMSSIFLYKKAEVFLLPFFFARKQLPFSQHRLSGGAQTAHAVHPFRAAPFLHRLTGARELPQAGSPLTGGKFFAETSAVGIRRLRTAGAVAAPAAGAKRKDNLRFSFLFELLPFPYSLVWRRLPTCDRFEKGERQRIFTSVSFSANSQCQIPYCYTYRLLYAGANIVRPRNGKPSRPCANEVCAMTAAFSILHSQFSISGKIKGRSRVLFYLLRAPSTENPSVSDAADLRRTPSARSALRYCRRP